MSVEYATPPTIEGDDAVARAAFEKAEIRRMHRNDRAFFLFHNGMTLTQLGLMAACAWTWMHGWWPVTIVLWGIAAHVGHSKLIAFHEASHATLNKRRWLNELQGIGVGTVILVPLSVYRYVHNQHHTYLASERDCEMWPYIDTHVPRWQRRIIAFCELFLGYFTTPILYGRGVLKATNIPATQKRRIVWEYVLCATVWTIALTLITIYGWWEPFLVGFFVPSLLSGNLQSIRKFTEHMGLRGDTILTVTRTVVDPSQLGKFLSDSMLHIDYHGTHHRYAKIPHYNLPAVTPYVYKGDKPAIAVFPSYRAAMGDMIRSLGDPRIGPQWDHEPAKH